MRPPFSPILNALVIAVFSLVSCDSKKATVEREFSSPLVELLGQPLDSAHAQSVLSSYSLSSNSDPEKQQREKRLGEFTLKDRPQGLVILHDANQKVLTIFLHASGHNDYEGYSGELPGGITLNDNRNAVREELGEPTKSRDEGFTDDVLGPQGPWDRFDFRDCSLHIQYDMDATRIELVTLMAPERVPR